VEIQQQSNKKEQTNPMWTNPWRYRESLVIALLVLILGIIFDVMTRGAAVKPVSTPSNIFIGIGFVLLLLFLSIGYKDKPLVIWLSGVPAAISAISLFFMLMILMGIIPQEQTDVSAFFGRTGLWHIKSSWPFLFSEVYFLTVLGIVTIRRSVPFKGYNIGFFFNHLGLWVAITAALLGAGDIQTININLLTGGQESNIGISRQGETMKLPFTLKLLQFTIQEYNPRLVLIDTHTGKPVKSLDHSAPVIEKNLKTKMNKWQIEVTDYLPAALNEDGRLQPSEEPGSYPAAKLTAVNSISGDTIKGWVSSGSYMQSPVYMPLDTNQILYLNTPEPKKYSSVLEVITDSLKRDTLELGVNKPIIAGKWKIYQTGYDKSKGKWSSLSVLEVVKDPWLPLVYAGMILLLTGSVFLFWKGKNRSLVFRDLPGNAK
jgi:hypothetical protein